MSFPEYEYITTVDVHEFCETVYGDDQPVAEWFDDMGSPVHGTAATCAGIAIAGGTASAIGGPATIIGGATIAGKLCIAGAGGCAVEGIFSKQTTCNGVEIDIYGHKNPNELVDAPPILTVPVCNNELDVGEMADSIEDHADGVVATAEDIASDLADGAGDVLSEGRDLIGI